MLFVQGLREATRTGQCKQYRNQIVIDYLSLSLDKQYSCF